MVGTAANHFACNGRPYAGHTHGDVQYACAWACHPRLVSFLSILYVYWTRPAFLARNLAFALYLIIQFTALCTT